ncbi:MAG: hypothetical protein JST68_29625 [Bacteroidetes bacterium]|nr:hypothetical protein [Bacteroidota bacterium]
MKYSQWIGVAAALLLVGACFMPWAYYPDLNKEFTGFFSELNRYGRPGKILIFFAVIEIVLFLIPKIGAKRANIFVTAMCVAFAIKSFILYAACYRGICPERRIGLWLVLVLSVIGVVASWLPNIPVKEDKAEG